MSATCELEVQRDGRRASGRLEDGLARLLVPRADGLEEIAVAADLLPDALARLVDLGPRPRIEPGRRLRYEPAELASPIADQTRRAHTDALEQGMGGEVDRDPLATVHSHWKVEARWKRSPSSPGVREIEVVDTEAALWLVVRSSSEVELHSATSMEIFSQLAALPLAD